MPRYSLVIPSGWEEQPVSIADLGGTEIDMRYSSPEEGALSVVVAPILRFLDVGFNANVTLSDIGSPEKVLTGDAWRAEGGGDSRAWPGNPARRSLRWFPPCAPCLPTPLTGCEA